MSDLNFGIMTGMPMPEPGRTVYQLPVHPINGLNSLAGGIAQGMQQGQQIQMDKARLGLQQQLAPSQIALAQAQAQQAQMQVAQANAQIQRQNALAGLAQDQQPGNPQMAGIQPQGASIPSQGMSQGQPGMSSPIGQPQIAPQQTPVQQGQPQDYNAAVVDYYKKIGRPDLAMSTLTAQQTLMDSTIKNKKALMDMTDQEAKTKYEHFEHAGAVAYGLTNLPDDQSIDQYNKTYGKIITGIDPNAPKPGSNKDDVLAYLHGASAAYMQVKQAVGANPALAAKVLPTKEAQDQFAKTASGESKPTETAKAQDLVQQRQTELDTVIQSKGSKSPEAREAQQRLEEAKKAVSKTTKTGGILEGITAPIGDALGGLVNKVGNLIPEKKQAVSGKTYTFNPKTGKLE